MAKVTPAEKERTRRAILEAAHRHFLRNGFEKTSVRAIAKEVGIGASTLYGYFEKKTDLLIYTFADLFSLQEAQVDDLLTLWDGDMTPKGVADLFASITLLQLEPIIRLDKELLRQFFQHVNLEQQFMELRKKFEPFGGVRKAMVRVLTICQNEGRLQTELALEMLATTLTDVTAGHIVTFLYNKGFTKEHLRLLLKQTYYVILVDKM